jgi:hypothetical protein
MAQNGFGGQWIEISKLGNHRDSTGTERGINKQFIDQVIANFTPNDAPAVVGHPVENAPAFGWASEIRLNGDAIEVRFSDTDDEFERLVREGKYRKRSASFYLNPPKLRHIGFLGAQPPAIKGLREISFSDGDNFAVETSFSEGETMSKENETTEEKKTLKEWFKEVFGGAGAPAPAPANFSETDAQKLISDAVKSATENLTAQFNEKLTAVETENKTLKEQVNKISDSGKRAEIISFVESIPAEKGKHFLKRAGVVEFLESLAIADAADSAPAVVCFSEGEDGKREEVKFSRLDWAKELFQGLPNFIQFGESFGSLNATNAADIAVTPERLNELRTKMGIEGGAK